MTEKEKTMYSFISELSKSQFPIIIKGALITKLILDEHNYVDVERRTQDIDINWVKTPPAMNELKNSIQSVLDNYNQNYIAVVKREYGDKRAAKIAVTDKTNGDEIFSMDIDMKPMLGSRTYYFGEAKIRGVLPNEVIADKIFILSTPLIYKHRAKDIVDAYNLSRCLEIETESVHSINQMRGRTLQNYDGFLNHKSELQHAYERLRGIDGKPDFEALYNHLQNFLKPFINGEQSAMIWNPEKYVWDKKYNYMKVTPEQAELLQKANISFEGNIFQNRDSVIRYPSKSQQAVEQALTSSRNKLIK
ncbi:MAG: nucleotidyl transferase AbiEii/AbiGii toxin family protein [Ruminococcus sp.]|nr:nucleotidyl transferase AbiEii/AbiGii toxin family protein [Ruminococcus sp.]